MGLFLGTSEPSKIFVGDTSISKVFLGDTQVRPSGWQPGANTIAYYPLETDFNDATTNGYDLTNSGGVITSLNGIACAYYNTGTRSRNTTLPIGTTRTLSCWYCGSQNTQNSVLVWAGSATSTKVTAISLSGGNKPNISNYWSYGTSSNTTFSTNAWHNFVGTINGATWKIYVDGDLIYTGGAAISSDIGCCIGGRNDANPGDSWYKGYIKSVIIENKVRTAQEIQDYFNQTKGDYGIS